jgi:methylglyoxal synthase
MLMTNKIIMMGLNKKIALVAHDNKKRDLVEWAKFNRDLLAHHKIYATGTTGVLLERELAFPISKLQSGPLGGDQQIGAKIVEGEIDFLIFFWDPLEQQAHDPDVKALLRMAMVWNIPTACDRASADFMISSPLMDKTYERLVPDYEVYRNRKVPGVETPPIPIPGVVENKKLVRAKQPKDGGAAQAAASEVGGALVAPAG